MRRMIGGELALNRLLLLPPRHAAFQAAIWLMPTAPVQMQKAVDWGVIGTLEGKNVLVRLVAQHESMPVTVQQVIEALKEARGHRAESCLLCLTAPLSKEGAAYAETANPPIRVIQREELVRLAGLCSPATDEDLSALGRKKRARRSAKEWARIMLDSSRARRYRAGRAGSADGTVGVSVSGSGMPRAVCRVQAAGNPRRACPGITRRPTCSHLCAGVGQANPLFNRKRLAPHRGG